MFRSAVSLLTASMILGHAVFGCCLPHAHADEQEAVPVLGPETARCCQSGGDEDRHDHHGTHHTHVEGDSCTFLVSPGVKLPADSSPGWFHSAACAQPLAQLQGQVRSTAQDPDLSRSGLPPTCAVRDLTQVWLL